MPRMKGNHADDRLKLSVLGWRTAGAWRCRGCGQQAPYPMLSKWACSFGLDELTTQFAVLRELLSARDRHAAALALRARVSRNTGEEILTRLTRHFTDRSELLSAERVAAGNASRFETRHEPTRALRRGAMGERVRHHVSLRPPLQSIVSDG